MNRDDDAHLHRSANSGSASRNPPTLEALGWGSFVAQRTRAEALSDTPPMRVVAIHRSGFAVGGRPT